MCFTPREIWHPGGHGDMLPLVIELSRYCKVAMALSRSIIALFRSEIAESRCRIAMSRSAMAVFFSERARFLS